MTKILITGFRHSGTTMTRLLIQAHPNVEHIFDEESFIEFDRPKEWMLKIVQNRIKDPNNMSWGEKIPWGNRVMDKDAERAIQFSKKWMKFFGSKARVVHVVRHPIDAAISGPGDGSMGVEHKKSLKNILNSVPKFIEFCNSDKRCVSVIYEDILTNTESTLAKLFCFLSLPFDKKIYKKIITTQLKFGGINASRAYAYRRKGIPDGKVDYDGIRAGIVNGI
jgi:hypothetical protein